jgi:hypothetical protein
VINLKKINRAVVDLITHSNITTKISIFFSTKTAGEAYDPYEKNWTYSNLNPLTIQGYVRDVKAEALVWKQYGLSEIGAKEIICEDKYIEYFRKCTKIEIDSDIYQVYKENVGNRMLIEKRPMKLLRVVVTKVK